MARKKTNWGKPGETGVTKDGIPWAVPESGPGRMSKVLYTLFPGGGNYMPAGARFVPASTAAEVHERIMRKYGEGIAGLLGEDEKLVGFAEFELGDNVPQPPRGAIAAKVGPNPLKQWWMGGGWDTMAGEVVARIGNTRSVDDRGSHVGLRDEVWIRTDRRIMIWGGTMASPTIEHAEFALGQVGIRHGWFADKPPYGDRARVDIAFADGSWIGVRGGNSGVPGGSDPDADRDLLAELVGPSVTSAVLPALGRE